MKNTLIIIFALVHFSAYSSTLYKAKKATKLMGCHFEFTVVAQEEKIAWEAIASGIAEIQRIEMLISSWNPTSQTSLINKNAGIKPVQIDNELFQLIYRAKKVSNLTDGAFDLSFSSMENIWNFNKLEQLLPDSNIVQEAAAKINWQNILLDSKKKTVYLKEKGMRIGFGAIGKGYAANRAKEIMSIFPLVKGGLINASGDIATWGIDQNAAPWKIHIANPGNKEKSLGWVNLSNTCIVTSGNYEKYFSVEGKRYAHIINPKTGYPSSGIKSVTIICPDAEVADALATAVFVLGKDQGLSLVDKINHVECIIIDDEDQQFNSTNLILNNE